MVLLKTWLHYRDFYYDLTKADSLWCCGNVGVLSCNLLNTGAIVSKKLLTYSGDTDGKTTHILPHDAENEWKRNYSKCELKS